MIRTILTKQISKSTIREVLFIAFLFIIGIWFRIWFVSQVPQPYGWDQYEYSSYALKIWENNMFASFSHRTYPYPLLLITVYRFVGWGHHWDVVTLQAILESITALFVYLIIRLGIGDRRASIIGATLYTFNPFTAGYVGVILSEVLTTFAIAGTIVSGLAFVRKPRWIWALLLGLFGGLAAETRNAALVWSLIPVVLSIIYVPLKRYWRLYALIAVGFFVVFSYQLYVNWRDYKEITISHVDSFFAKEFFQGALLKRLPPFTYSYPPESFIMWNEYYSEYFPNRTKEERHAMARKYYAMGWEIIRRDPWDYIRTRLGKMWYVWQKENIFFYKEPGYESHKIYTYMGNLLLLGFAITWLVSAGFARMRRVARWTWGSLVGSALYATIGFSFTHAEYRLTIPYYPLLIAASALGISWIWQAIKLLSSKR